MITSNRRCSIRQEISPSANFFCHLLAQQVFLLSQLLREVLSKICSLIPGTNLTFQFARHRVRTTLQPFHCFFHRAHLPDPVTRNQFFGFREWPVNYRPLGSREPHSLALGRWF